MEEVKMYIWQVMLRKLKNNKNAKETAKNISTVYSQDIITDGQVRNKFSVLFRWYIIERSTQTRMGCPRGVMVKPMDCGIVVHEFVLQSHYYVHFRANTLGKGMNPLILPAMC